MKTRIIQTSFWEDSFISDLPIKTKLLFLYCLTNVRIELTGAYQIPIKNIAVETGLSIKEVEEGFSEIRQKISYISGYVVVKNHKKYQNYENGSEKQQQAFQNEFNRLPDVVKKALNGDDLTSCQLVNNQLGTSPELVLNKNIEIRKQKIENEVVVDREISNISRSQFIAKKEEYLAKAKELYPNKNCEKAMQAFIEQTGIKDYKYKNYMLAFFKWVREDKFNQYNILRVSNNYKEGNDYVDKKTREWEAILEERKKKIVKKF